MADDRKSIEDIVLTRVMRLNASVHGLAAGIILGLGIFVATIWLILKGGEIVGPHLGLLSHFFIGYKVSVAGSLIGFAYGFLSGFVIGYFVASTYNWLVDLKERGSAAQS